MNRKEPSPTRPFYYEGNDPIPFFHETMEEHHQRVLAAREAAKEQRK